MTAIALSGFHGGVRVERHKEALRGGASRRLPMPPRLIYPLGAHVGTGATPVVRVGQRVRAGETIAMPGSYVSQAIHSAAGGIVRAIGELPVIGVSGVADRCIVIEPVDGAGGLVPMSPLDPDRASAEALLARIADAGVIGMGGAGFPSHVKLREGQRRWQAGHQGADLLIINGVECEPMIASDDCLMREQAVDVIDGARVLMRAVGASRCIIAIEDDMAGALAAMRALSSSVIDVVAVPDIYPAGGEKQLIRMLTGVEVPTHSLPIDVGVIMHNVATAVAAADAVLRGLPLTERMVTVTGEVGEPVNLRVPIGTPVRHLIDAAGGCGPDTRVVAGGPMMGLEVEDLDVPVVKTTNAVIAIALSAATTEMPCIRCGECVDACPAQLQPQALLEFIRAGDWDSAQDYHLFDCIECGACAYVCPSRIPLVHDYRFGKATIAASDRAQARADELRERHRVHVARVGACDLTEDPADDFDGDGEEAGIAGDDRSAPTASAENETLAMQREIAAARERVRARRAAPAATAGATVSPATPGSPPAGPVR